MFRKAWEFVRQVWWDAKIAFWMLLSWKEQKKEKKPEGPSPLGSFDDRGIWYYGDREMDPFEIDRKIREHGNGDAWADAITVMRAADATKALPEFADKNKDILRHAFDSIVDLSRKVFDLPAVKDSCEEGWTDSEAWNLFADYLRAWASLGSEFLPLPKQLA